jgi:hypothetical protein
MSSLEKNDDSSVNLPKNDHEAKHFEATYVHQVYNQIADHFSSTRHSAWPGVVEFIKSLEPYSLMLDVGCGNGKYLSIRNDLYCVLYSYSSSIYIKGGAYCLTVFSSIDKTKTVHVFCENFFW